MSVLPPCIIAERLSATTEKYKYSGVRVGVKTEKEWGDIADFA